jgi:hypothetical protein
MKHFAELLQEAETKMPLSFYNLIESINSGCLTEAETFSFCDSFGTFLKEFHPAYLNVASYFGLDDKLFRDRNYKDTEAVKQFIRDVLNVAKGIKENNKFLVDIAKEKSISPYHKEIIDHYNKFVNILNTSSKSLFAMIKTAPKKGDCEKMEIISDHFLSLFNGADILPLINYTGKVA